MKAEHRKELQTNVLADRLGKFIKGLKAGPSRGAVIFWGVVLLVGVLVLVWVLFKRSAEADNSALWLQLDEADVNELNSLAQQNPGKLQGRLARFDLARFDLEQGLRQFAWEYDKATKALKNAAEEYEKLIDESKDEPALNQEALLGAAKANESLGELDRAKGFYERLAKDHPKSPFAAEASRRAEQIEKDGASLKDFYQKMSNLAQGKENP